MPQASCSLRGIIKAMGFGQTFRMEVMDGHGVALLSGSTPKVAPRGRKDSMAVL
jgi:hypothetical protein